MSNLSIKGKLIKKFPTQEIEKKDGGIFKKRGFSIETDAKYNNLIHFECIKEELIESLDAFETGVEITIHFNLHSREYNGKFYHNINAWKIEEGEIKTTDSSEEDDDVPF